MDKTELDNHRITEKDLADIIIDNEMLKEAEEIEKSVENVEVPFREGDEERDLERLLERARLETEKEKNISKIEEFTKSADEYEKKRRKRIRMATRAAAAIVVLGIGIFGVSMTSEANRLRVMEVLDKTFETETQTQINNSSDRQYSNNDEKLVRDEIYKKLHAEVPEFFYLPENTQFSGSSLDLEAGVAYLIYEYNGNNLILYISINDQDASDNRTFDSNNELDNAIKLDIMGNKMDIFIEKKDDNTYTAKWDYHNTYYELGGLIDKAELERIIENMLF